MIKPSCTKKNFLECGHGRAQKIFQLIGELETCVGFPIYRELLPAGDGTDSREQDDHADVLAQVSPAPQHEVAICQVSVATVKNTIRVLCQCYAFLFFLSVLCPKWE